MIEGRRGSACTEFWRLPRIGTPRGSGSVWYDRMAMGNTPRKSSMLTLKLPAQLERQLARVAELRGVSKSEVAREALARFVAEPQPQPYGPSVLDLAGDLVGRIGGGPGDLATNPAHLEDFGRD